MELDLFGIKIGNKGNEKTGSKATTEWRITKEELCNKLGYNAENVTWISYDANKKELIIKEKQEVN